MSIDNQIPKPVCSTTLVEQVTTCHGQDLHRDAVDMDSPSHMSLRTLVLLDSPQQSDDEGSIGDGCISAYSSSADKPLSFGTRWIRFFPELATNFSLSLPTAAGAKGLTSSFSYMAHQESGDNWSRALNDPLTFVDANTASLPGFEVVDDTSSCYSLKAFSTSASSELRTENEVSVRRSDRSAEDFSILSPVDAGVFESDSPVYQLLSSPESTSSGDKLLPRDSTFNLASLGLRRKPSPLSYASNGDCVPGNNINGATSRPPIRLKRTIARAAEELEDALADFRTRNERTKGGVQGATEPFSVTKDSIGLTLPTSTAPHLRDKVTLNGSVSNTHITSHQLADSSDSSYGQKHTKRQVRYKGLFPFGASRFVRRRRSVAYRKSVSSSDVEPGTGPPYSRRSGATSLSQNATGVYNKDNAEVLPSDSSYQCPERLSSLNHSRELWQGDPFDRMLTLSEATRRLGTFKLVHYAGSFQTPDIVFELEAGAPTELCKARTLPFSVPDSVIFSILDYSGSLGSLFNFALVNRNFYCVFKKNELRLIKNALFDMSPPAWELRQASSPLDVEWQRLAEPDTPAPEYTANLYLRRYAQDIFVLARLKSIMLARCSLFLRYGTVSGLTGVDSTRAAEVDEAFWRIWAFCRIFGCHMSRENETLLQVDWLNGGPRASGGYIDESIAMTASTDIIFEPHAGFGRGNASGLSQNQLYDIIEVWMCLKALLQPLHGKCAEAREAGIFDAFDIQEGDSTAEEAILQEWTSYVLTLGLSTVLCLSSVSTADATTAVVFHTAKSLGLTKWGPLESKRGYSAFLKEAISKVYKLRQAESSSRHLLERTDPHKKNTQPALVFAPKEYSQDSHECER